MGDRGDWNVLIGKTISVVLKSGSFFTGVVTEIVDTGDNFIWIHMIDKFEKIVVFLTTEIAELREK